MENRHGSLIFKPSEVNVVDMATSDVVADSYIRMASDIIFHESRESDRVVGEVVGPQRFSGFEVSDGLGKGKSGPRFTI
jgi:hypothetical protein